MKRLLRQTAYETKVRQTEETQVRSPPYETGFETLQVSNNAGIGVSGDVEIAPFKDIERVIDIDYWGVVNGTKAFLPHLIASGDGHVINVSSAFGLFAMPGQAVE